MQRRPKKSGWSSQPLRLFGSTGPYAFFSYNYRCPNTECKVKWTIAHRCKLSRLTRAFLPFVLNERFGVASEVISSVRKALISGTSFEGEPPNRNPSPDQDVEAPVDEAVEERASSSTATRGPTQPQAPPQAPQQSPQPQALPQAPTQAPLPVPQAQADAYIQHTQAQVNARVLIRDQTQRALNTANLQLAHYHALGHQRAWTPQDVHTIRVVMQRAEDLGRGLPPPSSAPRRTTLYGARRRDFRSRSRDFTQFHGALNKVREIHLVCKKFYIEPINGTSFDAL